jgi:hypothetical protein
MEQPTPNVNETDVERIVRRDFSSQAVERAKAILNQFGGEIWHREKPRVRLACLKLAAGDLGKLQREIDTAKLDYRDVLASAEYPNYFQNVPGPEAPPAKQEQRIIQADWEQYQSWLSR